MDIIAAAALIAVGIVAAAVVYAIVTAGALHARAGPRSRPPPAAMTAAAVARTSELGRARRPSARPEPLSERRSPRREAELGAEDRERAERETIASRAPS